MKTSANSSTKIPFVYFISFKYRLLLSVFVLSLITAGCSDDSGSDDSQQQAQETSADDNNNEQAKDELVEAEEDGKKKKEKPAIPVEVVSVARGDIQQTYRTITTLEAERDVQVVARSTGLLQNILVEEGDQVVKGQLLAQLDVEQLSLEVAQLAATSQKLNKELDRQQSLYQKSLTSSDALDRATFEYRAQLAQYELSKLKLNYASIKAPISGVVTERMVKTGNLIRDNDILFKIVDLNSLKAVLHLPEMQLANIKKDQRILLSVDALQGEVIEGAVERIRPAIDTDTGTFKVVAKIDNKDNFLKSGMFGKVEVVFDVHHDSLILEQQAIITQDNRSHVFVATNNQAIRTPVTIGFKYNGLVEVIDGLNEADKVITTGQQILKHESKIEVVGQTDEQIATDNSKDAQTPSSVAMNP